MSGGARQRDNLTPSLFPFLAVLLCTMGSLVLILMLIVSGAQSDAQQAKQLAEEQLEERKGLAEHASGFFRKEMDDINLELEKERLVLQHYEEHILELADELDSLNNTLADGKSTEGETAASLTEKQEQIQRELSALEKQLAEAEKELAKAPEKSDGDKPIFAVIPYAGPNGTHRRPIYVECNEDGVTLQPEGNRLSLADLEPPHGPGNPLDAALRAIRSEYRPATEALTTTAYPLLLVRPSGIRAYALARSAMSGWDDQFGYELVDEDMELAFPKGTSGLYDKVARAIQLAQERQSALAMAMPQKYSQQGTGPLGANRSRGSMAQGSTTRGGTPSSKISFFESPQNGSDGLQSAQGVGNRSGTGDSSGIGNSTGRGGFSTAQPGEMLAGADGSYFGSPNNGDNSSSSNRYSNPTGSDAGVYGFARNAMEQSPDSVMTGGRGGSNGSAGREQGGYQEDLASMQLYSGSNGFAGSLDGGSERAGAPDGSMGDAEYGASSLQSPGERKQSMAANGGNSSANGPVSGGEGAGAGSQQGGQSSGSSKATANQASPSQMAGQTGGGGGSGASPSRGGSQMSGMQNSSAAQNGNPDSEQNSQPGMPSLDMTFSNQRPESTSPVAENRGRNWAYQPRSRQRTTVVRNIHLHCFTDRWVVLPDDGNPSKALTIPFEGTPEERADQLAKSIRERVDSWGLALAGGTWKPVLVVDVAPQADWRFDQLQRLFRGSGLEVEKRSRTANSNARERRR